ncbi:hypothetical protein Bca4012_090854 [Brassica carinata]
MAEEGGVSGEDMDGRVIIAQVLGENTDRSDGETWLGLPCDPSKKEEEAQQLKEEGSDLETSGGSQSISFREVKRIIIGERLEARMRKIAPVAGNPLICRSRPPEFCSGYHLFKSSFCFVELLIGEVEFGVSDLRTMAADESSPRKRGREVEFGMEIPRTTSADRTHPRSKPRPTYPFVLGQTRVCRV